MSETPTRTEANASTWLDGDLRRTRALLTYVYGAVPIVAGVDKFTNALATWTEYLPEAVASAVPVEAATLMHAVGVVEIAAGLLVLSRYRRFGAALVAAWLVAVAGTQVLAGNLAVAVRDLVMAVGAFALLQLVVADLE